MKAFLIICILSFLGCNDSSDRTTDKPMISNTTENISINEPGKNEKSRYLDQLTWMSGIVNIVDYNYYEEKLYLLCQTTDITEEEHYLNSSGRYLNQVQSMTAGVELEKNFIPQQGLKVYSIDFNSDMVVNSIGFSFIKKNGLGIVYIDKQDGERLYFRRTIIDLGGLDKLYSKIVFSDDGNAVFQLGGDNSKVIEMKDTLSSVLFQPSDDVMQLGKSYLNNHIGKSLNQLGYYDDEYEDWYLGYSVYCGRLKNEQSGVFLTTLVNNDPGKGVFWKNKMAFLVVSEKIDSIKVLENVEENALSILEMNKLMTLRDLKGRMVIGEDLKVFVSMSITYVFPDSEDRQDEIQERDVPRLFELNPIGTHVQFYKDKKIVSNRKLEDNDFNLVLSKDSLYIIAACKNRGYNGWCMTANEIRASWKMDFELPKGYYFKGNILDSIVCNQKMKEDDPRPIFVGVNYTDNFELHSLHSTAFSARLLSYEIQNYGLNGKYVKRRYATYPNRVSLMGVIPIDGKGVFLIERVRYDREIKKLRIYSSLGINDRYYIDDFNMLDYNISDNIGFTRITSTNNMYHMRTWYDDLDTCFLVEQNPEVHTFYSKYELSDASNRMYSPLYLSYYLAGYDNVVLDTYSFEEKPVFLTLNNASGIYDPEKDIVLLDNGYVCHDIQSFKDAREVFLRVFFKDYTRGKKVVFIK